MNNRIKTSKILSRDDRIKKGIRQKYLQQSRKDGKINKEEQTLIDELRADKSARYNGVGINFIGYKNGGVTCEYNYDSQPLRHYVYTRGGRLVYKKSCPDSLKKDIETLKQYKIVPILKIPFMTEEEILKKVNSIPKSFRKSSNDNLAESASNRPLEIVGAGTKKSVKKNNRLKKLALERENHKCQIDSSHTTFVTKAGVSYMEGHHLIPCTEPNAMLFWDKYGKNIDCVENILCICPTCHRAFHYGDRQTKETMVKAIFEKQIKSLKRVGIRITEEDLLKLYKISK